MAIAAPNENAPRTKVIIKTMGEYRSNRSFGVKIILIKSAKSNPYAVARQGNRVKKCVTKG
jgi:hypothetical protein